MNQELVDAIIVLVKHAETTGQGRDILEAAARVREEILAEGVDFISEDEELDTETKFGRNTSALGKI